MTRLEWQVLAREWATDAAAMLEKQRWGCADYVAGCAVECGLKACVLKRLEAGAGVVFSDRKFAGACRTHDLDTLLELAGLDGELKAETRTNPAFSANWSIVEDWSEEMRYDRMQQADAESLVAAIVDSDGVLPWIERRWS